jgi:hypothetical protein
MESIASIVAPVTFATAIPVISTFVFIRFPQANARRWRISRKVGGENLTFFPESSSQTAEYQSDLFQGV